MSEHESGASSGMEAALLDQLARQEKRISLLEAQLEETRRQSQTTEHVRRDGGATAYETPASTRQGGAMAYAAPAPANTGGAMAFEMPSSRQVAVVRTEVRKPIALPEFTGSGVDAIADAVRERAFAQAYPSAQLMGQEDVTPETTGHTPRDAEAHEADFEPTVRFHAPLRGLGQAGARTNAFSLRRVGALSLLSVVVAGLGVGAWEYHRSLLPSPASGASAITSLVTAPVPLPSATSRQAAVSPPAQAPPPKRTEPARLRPSVSRRLTGNTPIIEPQDATRQSLRNKHRLVSGSGAASIPTGALLTHSSAQSRAGSHARSAHSDRMAVASALRSQSPRPDATRRHGAQGEYGNAGTWNAPPQERDRFASDWPETRRNRRQDSDAELSQDDSRPAFDTDAPDERHSRYPDDRNVNRGEEPPARAEYGRRPRRRSRQASDTYRVTQPSEERPPRRTQQGQVRRAMNTLDEMQDLLDSIERRKRRQADSNSE